MASESPVGVRTGESEIPKLEPGNLCPVATKTICQRVNVRSAVSIFNAQWRGPERSPPQDERNFMPGSGLFHSSATSVCSGRTLAVKSQDLPKSGRHKHMDSDEYEQSRYRASQEIEQTS